MNDASTVNILHTPHYLVDKKLNMIIRQLLSLDDVVEVSPHEVSHHVHIGELVQTDLGGEAVQQSNNLTLEHNYY